MQIILENNYMITSDNYQFILGNIIPDEAYEGGYKRHTNDKGELGSLVRKNVTFHGSFDGLVTELKNRQLKSSDVHTLKELGKKIQEIDEYINKMMADIWNEVK